MRHLLGQLGRGWMAFAHLLGRIQTFLILSVIYVIAIGVIAPVYRLFAGDPLDRSPRRPGSVWVTKPRSNTTVAEARHLF